MSQQVEFTCGYCDFKWTDNVWNVSVAENKQCKRCQDKNIKVKQQTEDTKIDYYKKS